MTNLGLTREAVVALALLCALVLSASASAREFVLTSPVLSAGGEIPMRFTCDGRGVSPALKWHDVPSGTRSFALIVSDPDAPSGTWIHWVVFNIPAGDTALPGGNHAARGAGADTGVNSWKRTGYGAPCPPSGRHRYVFRLFALDTRLQGLASPDAQALRAAMSGHVIARATLTTTYRRHR